MIYYALRKLAEEEKLNCKALTLISSSVKYSEANEAVLPHKVANTIELQLFLTSIIFTQAVVAVAYVFYEALTDDAAQLPIYALLIVCVPVYLAIGKIIKSHLGVIAENAHKRAEKNNLLSGDGLCLVLPEEIKPPSIGWFFRFSRS